MLAMMTDMKRLKVAEIERVKIHQEINKLHGIYADLDCYYKERVKEGKSVIASMKKLDDLQEEIAILEKQLSQVQGQINSQKSLSGISKVIYELSVKDPLAYNLELNKTGLKIHLKDKELYFYDPDMREQIASLRYMKYDRSRKEYVYSFSGVRKYYSSESYIGTVRTEDWTSEKLLHPRRPGLSTSRDMAALFHNLNIFDKSGTSFTLNLDE